MWKLAIQMYIPYNLSKIFKFFGKTVYFVCSISAFLSFPVSRRPPRGEEGAAAFSSQTATGNRAEFIFLVSVFLNPHLFYPPKNFAYSLFAISPGTWTCPKSNLKQCLCKFLGSKGGVLWDLCK